nr:allene oxide synthase 3-like isoform X1 [Ipomoea batatas]
MSCPAPKVRTSDLNAQVGLSGHKDHLYMWAKVANHIICPVTLEPDTSGISMYGDLSKTPSSSPVKFRVFGESATSVLDEAEKNGLKRDELKSSITWFSSLGSTPTAAAYPAKDMGWV